MTARRRGKDVVCLCVCVWGGVMVGDGRGKLTVGTQLQIFSRKLQTVFC